MKLADSRQRALGNRIVVLVHGEIIGTYTASGSLALLIDDIVFLSTRPSTVDIKDDDHASGKLGGAESSKRKWDGWVTYPYVDIWKRRPLSSSQCIDKWPPYPNTYPNRPQPQQIRLKIPSSILYSLYNSVFSSIFCQTHSTMSSSTTIESYRNPHGKVPKLNWIELNLPPILNPKSYDGARVFQNSLEQTIEHGAMAWNSCSRVLASGRIVPGIEKTPQWPIIPSPIALSPIVPAPS